MNQKSYIYGFTTAVVAVGAGVTAAAFVVPPPNCNSLSFQVPRNDIALLPFRTGSTLTLDNLVAGQSLGFPLSTGPLYSFIGAPAFVLFSSGATATVPLLWGLSDLGATLRSP